MEEKKVRFAILGTGMIAGFHRAAILASQGGVLAGVCGSSPERTAAQAREWGVRGYAPEELWADGSIDAVCICTPSGLHGPQALEAIRHCKHVLVEKPLALSLEDCDAIIRAAREQGVQAAVVSQCRLSASVARAKEALEAGILGRPVCFELSMKYYRSQSYYSASSWRGTWAMDGGALMNQGIHGVDLMQYLAGPVRLVYARSATLAHEMEAEDTLTAVVEFASGALGTVTASTAVWPGCSRQLFLCGDRGSIRLEEDGVKEWNVEGLSPPEPEMAQILCGASNPSATGMEGHRKHIQNLIEAIRGREALLLDGEEGRKSVEIVLAAYQSARTGLPVVLKSR